MSKSFGKYHFEIVVNNMDDFEIIHSDGFIKGLTFIEMEDLINALNEAGKYVRSEREKWAKERSNEND